MARRAHNTLILIQASRLIRADFSASPRPELIKIYQQARPVEVPLPDLVQAAIKLGPRCGKRVWVLCEDLWTQMLSFPMATVSGLDDKQLVRAFAFESEPLSGISGIDAAIGFTPAERTDDARSFWIATTDVSARDQIQAVVRRNGGKLFGILHPGGLPAAIRPAPGNQNWSRVEVWHHATLCISGAGQVRNKIQVINANTTQQRVRDSISSWLAGGGAAQAEYLDAEGKAETQAAESSGRRFTLLAEADLAAWLSAWMENLSAVPPQIPLILPAPVATPKSAFITAGIVAEVAALALCLGHWYWVDHLRREFSGSADVDKHKAQDVSDIVKRIDETTKELEKLKTQNDQTQNAMTAAEAAFARQRMRVSLLLKGLAEQRPDDVIIESIKGNGMVTTVKGISLGSALPDELASKLAVALKPAGIGVQPLDKEASNILKSGGPWSFTLGLSDPSAVPPLQAAVPGSSTFPRHGVRR